jgi:regulator of sigma E protease
MEVILNIIISGVIFIFLIGLVVFIHELGHFAAAKKVGVVVQEFAFGFGKAIWKKRYKGTDYRINLIPLGGYVKMLGDQDGSSFLRYTKKKYDKDDKKFALNLLKENHLDPEKSSYEKIERFGHEMGRSLSDVEYHKLQNYLIYDYIPNHPGNFDNVSIGKRALVISAGVIMNVILAVVLFYIFFLATGFYTDVRKIGEPVFWGVEVTNPPYLSFLDGTDNVKYSDSLVIKLNGELVNSEQEFKTYIADNPNLPVDLELQKLTDSGYYFVNAKLILNGDGIKSNFDSDLQGKPYITIVNDNSLAQHIGLEPGDFLISIAGTNIDNSTDLSTLLNDNSGNFVEIKYINRTLKEVTSETFLNKDEQGKVLLGISYYYFDSYPDALLRLDYSGNKALSGIYHSLNMTVYNFSGLAELIKQSFAQRSIEPVSSGVSSIVGVSDFVYNLVKVNDFVNIINLTALVSLSLAIMNFLPIPLFDGGHMFFLVLEKIRGKKISDSLQERIASIAFYGLVILSVLVIFKDVWQFNFLQRFGNLFTEIFGR